MASILSQGAFMLGTVEVWLAPCMISWDDRVMATHTHLHLSGSQFVFLHKGSEWILAPEPSFMVSAYVNTDIALCLGCSDCDCE